MSDVILMVIFYLTALLIISALVTEFRATKITNVRPISEAAADGDASLPTRQNEKTV